MNICDQVLCTGCGACANVCPKSCISINLDGEGFYKYYVDADHCINCNLCKKVCPSNGYRDFVEKKEPEAYLCWNFDEKIRMQSSSGGIFTLLAEEILDTNGIVFGATLDGSLNVKHISVDNKIELAKLRGSKYTQSHTNDTFKDTKIALEDGVSVLYSGTPCQIAGLYKFLGRDYQNLLTCDMVCHGVYSTKVYKDVLSYYENKYKSKIVDVKYRDKKTGWKNSSVKITFESGKEISQIKNISLLTYGFAAGFTNNETCSICIHSTIPRRADITLGDYGAGDYTNYSKIDKKNGISLMLINSIKGRSYFEFIKDNMYVEEKSMDTLLKVQKNIGQSNKLHPEREQFFIDYKNKDFNEIKNKYLTAPLKNKLIYKIGSERYYYVRRSIKKIVYKVMRKKHDN